MNHESLDLPPKDDPALAEQVPSVEVGDTPAPTEQITSSFRRMTHQDRVGAYEAEVQAYERWRADPNRTGFFRLPKHPDVEDREYREAQERRTKEARERSAQGFMFVAPFLFRRH